MALMVAVLVARTAESLASIPERLNAPAVERPYPLPEVDAVADVTLERLDEAWLEHRIRPGESFFQAMRAMGFGPGTVQSVMDAGQQARSLLDLKPGQVLRASAPTASFRPWTWRSTRSTSWKSGATSTATPHSCTPGRRKPCKARPPA